VDRTASPELMARLESLERANRRLTRILIFTVVAAGAYTLMPLRASYLAHAQQSRPDVLEVRELRVMDSRGIERVKIAGNLPDPIIQGKRVPRQGAVAGVLIFDEDGDERGGYVTNQNGDAFLSLDAKSYQQTLFIANRNGGANMSVWSGPNRNNNYVSVQAVPKPLIEIRQDGKTQVYAIGAETPPGK